MTGDKRILVAAAAAIAVAASAGLVAAQPVTNDPSLPIPGAGTGQPQSNSPPGAERADLALPTEAASLFGRDRNVSVTQRPHEGYQAAGLRMGAFLAYPKLSATAEHNDNIYATETNTKSDTVWRISPEVNLQSNWNRHAMGLYARAVINSFQNYSSENTTDYGAGVNGRLDMLRNSNLSGNLDWARLTEPRSSPNSPGLASEPVQYDLATAAISAQHEINRLRLSGRYQFQSYNYDSPPKIGGGIVDQSFRDRDVQLVMGRVDYAVSPDTAWFVEVAGNQRNYKHDPVAPGIRRDSDGVQALAGVNFDVGALARGEFAAGYLKQTFKDSRLQDSSGLAARAQLEWFPTQLTTVTFTGSRTIEDSSAPNVGTYISNNVSARVDHELLRNVILGARAAYGDDRYKQIGRVDHRTSAGLNATYLLNRALGLTGSYSYDKTHNVRGGGNNFTANKFAVTLTAQF